MTSIKTAVSLARTTFARVDALAREMRVPRSRIFALAVEEFLDRYDNQGLKAALDRAYQDSPSAGEKKWLDSTRRKHRQLIQGEW
jgi:predicted transcriptional regulator